MKFHVIVLSFCILLTCPLKALGSLEELERYTLHYLTFVESEYERFQTSTLKNEIKDSVNYQGYEIQIAKAKLLHKHAQVSELGQLEPIRTQTLIHKLKTILVLRFFRILE